MLPRRVPKCQDVTEIKNIWKYLFKSRYKWENEVSKSQPKLQGRRISSIVVKLRRIPLYE